MSSKLYIQNRLYNVNDRLTALDFFERIVGWIDEGLLADMQEPFLPFKTSNNASVDDEAGIFDMDIEHLSECDGVAGYFDGWTYDPGCGFEMGCGYAWGYPIHLITTDIFTSSVGGSTEFYKASKLSEHISKFVRVANLNQDIEDYRERNVDVLERAIEIFKANLIADFGEPRPAPTPIGALPIEYDYYLDPNFKYTESGRTLLSKIISAIKSVNKTYIIGDNQGDIAADIDNLRKSGQSIFLFDVAEPNVDSSILQGIAFGIERKPIVYASNDQRIFMSDKWVIHLNTMNYHSAAAVVSSIAELNALIGATEVFTRYEETGRFRYTGEWYLHAITPDTPFSNGRTMETVQDGASFEFAFEGTTFRIISYRGSGQGSFEVHIDDEFVTTVSAFSPAFEYQFVAYTSDILTYGIHKVKLVARTQIVTLIERYKTTIDAIETNGNLLNIWEH